MDKEKLKKIKQKGTTTTETENHPIGKITIVKKKEYKILKAILKYLIIIILAACISTAMVVYILDSGWLENSSKNNNLSDIGSIDNNTNSDNVAKAINDVTPSLVTITNESKDSKDGIKVTGFVVRENGYIATAYSSIKDFKSIYVEVPNISGKSFKATIVGEDTITNIAILKIDVDKLVPVKMSNNINQGQIAIAVGNNSGEEGGSLATIGVISNTDKLIDVTDQNNNVIKTGVLETDLNISKPIVGGVTVNLNGQVIGINTNTIENKDGFSYLVGVNYAQNVIKDLINDGRVSRVFLGIEGISATGHNKGVLINQVDEQGCAYKAGIRDGDIITDIDNIKVSNINEIYKIVKLKSVGDVVYINLIRNGNSMKIPMKLTY
ncbi:S1C family serine protease [Clostridium mediterraneense]|uniref:S1C family serine protease n=1 Tax=Clostridium mediterraneense TaxID=1805472 RepID=UPI0008311AD2|nr:S1C family serine protease [Clostridium mediterraneense]